FRTVSEFNAAYASGSTDPEKVAEKVLAAIRESNAGAKPLRAVVQVDEEDVRRAAKESAARWKEGKAIGPLDGVPVTIKENFAVKGYECRQGTAFLCRGSPSTYDAELVGRLRDAGALIAGITNMHELGWDINGINPFSGPGRNPYNLDRTSGGSSGGSAASVAAGIAPVSLGGDAGGSVRIPSAYCGLVGLKPTCGRLTLGPDGGQLSMATKGIHSATVGDLALTVPDLAPTLQYLAVAGKSDTDPLTAPQPPPHVYALLHPPTGLKIGVPTNLWAGLKHPGMEAICRRAVDALDRLGHTVTEFQFPELHQIKRGQFVSAVSEMATSADNLPIPAGSAAKTPWELLSPQLRYELLGFTRTFTAGDYLQALRMRHRGMDLAAGVFAEYDVIVTPATGNVGFPIHEGDEVHGASTPSSTVAGLFFTGFCNFLGLPAVVVPVGYLGGERDPTEEGMPVALQIAGKWWDEDVLMAVAAGLERELPERKRPEGSYWDVLA
ncbi:amidase signature domain-containing protein, partial [Hyaloraphidium curvatum]